MSRAPRFQSATEVAVGIRRGEISAVELVEAHFDRIERRDQTVNAFVDRFEADALAAARKADVAIERGEPLGPLHGVPVAVKDNLAVAGERFTKGSAALSDNVATEDALAVRRLREAGAILIGKTNLPEFGAKGVTDNDLFGATGTPFEPERTAGGSSGGSAAAVADGMATLAVGTDGGGSLRIPASACGVFGMKPTFGRVPIRGRPNGFGHHTPMLGLGPQSRTVEGGAMLLEALWGPHPADPLAFETGDPGLVAATRDTVAGLEIGYTPDLGGSFPVSDPVRDVFLDAVDAFAATAATLDPAGPDFSRSRREIYECWRSAFDVRIAETIAGLDGPGDGFYSGHRDALEDANVAAAERGRGMSAVEYRRCDVVRTDVFASIQSFFESCDLLVAPTLSVPPFEHGTRGPTAVDGESVDPTLEWALTWPFNLTGHPVASVPAGFTDDGLPVGMQIVGPRFADERVLAASGAFERVRPWRDAYERLA